jgi:hypothetical protein
VPDFSPPGPPEDEQISAIDADLEDLYFDWTPDGPENPDDSEAQMLAEHEAYFGADRISE